MIKPKHPWTEGQIERMNRKIKDATVKRFHYESHDQLRRPSGRLHDHLQLRLRLKTFNGLTPHEYSCMVRTSDPDRFILDPIHQMPGLNT